MKLGFIFTVTNHSVSHVHKSQRRESYSTQVIQSHRNPQSAQKPGSSGASPTSRLCFNQWLREKATSPAVCTASPPRRRLRTRTVTITPSQKWHQLPGTELLGWAAQRSDKSLRRRPAHFRENWYPGVFWLLQNSRLILTIDNTALLSRACWPPSFKTGAWYLQALKALGGFLSWCRST